MEKTWAFRVRPHVAAARKSRFADEEQVKNRKEGKKRVARASLAVGFFHQLRFSAAGARRPAWGLHHIARPPPRPCFLGMATRVIRTSIHAPIPHHHRDRLRAARPR
jgi:hypothetical protein